MFKHNNCIYNILDNHSRVKLLVPDEEGDDYINASYIHVSFIYVEELNHYTHNIIVFHLLITGIQ